VSELPSLGVSRPIPPRPGKQLSSTAALFQTGIPVVPGEAGYLAWDDPGTGAPDTCLPHDPQGRREGGRKNTPHHFGLICVCLNNLYLLGRQRRGSGKMLTPKMGGLPSLLRELWPFYSVVLDMEQWIHLCKIERFVPRSSARDTRHPCLNPRFIHGFSPY